MKLGCRLTNLANNCPRNSNGCKFYPFLSSDTDLLEKIREVMTGSPSTVFTRKAIANETYIRKSNHLGKSIDGVDANNLCPYSMCQDMPRGLYTRWDHNEETQKFKARQNRVFRFENTFMS